MLSVSSEDKQRKLDEVLEHLKAAKVDDNWELLESFTRVVYGGLPEWMIKGVSSKNLAGRLADNFRFFVKELPPPPQLYRGLPGLHVVARHSVEEEWLPSVGGKTIPLDTTIVETHTPDAPFIFDSLMNYFRKAGLRVFSAIHPILTVRRQWERVEWIGDAHAEGDKELLCRFRIEHIESKERLRRVQHEIFSVLKCLFLALEDFNEMTNTVSGLTGRMRSRIDESPDLQPAQAFLKWLTDENFILMGIMSYRISADGAADRIAESALGAFRDPALLPVVFPGLVEEVESQLAPAPDDERIIEIDYCSNASAIYHLEPIDDVVIRLWGEDGKLEQATFLLGRFSQGSFAQRAADVPLLREKRRWLIDRSGAAPMSHAFRQVRALFNKFPRRELFYAPAEELKPFFDRIVHITGDDEIAVHHRLGTGYAALYLAFSKVRYSHDCATALKRAFTERFGPVGFTASEDAGAVQILVFYFDLDRLDHPIDEDVALTVTEEIITTWMDHVSRTLTEAFGEREGRRLFGRWITYDTRSGIYREATPAEEVPFDVKHLEQLDARLQVAAVSRSPEHVTLKTYSTKPLNFIETLTTLKNLGLGVTGELHIPIRLPSGRNAHMHRYEVEDTPERIAALLDGTGRLADAVRALDEARATDGSLNALILTAGLEWRQVEVLRTFRAHLQQIRPHHNLETLNAVLLSNARAARALFRAFEARFDPALDAERQAVETEAEIELQAALDNIRSLVDDEVLRAVANLIAATTRTNFYQRPERPVFAMKVESAKVEGMPSPSPMCEIYVRSRKLEGVHLRGGRVARGGIRWSDRHDDFRTEVLDLQKTQMLKNSIIVPVGSKGGFVLKGELPPRPALDGYLVDRYREFISGLLDVTDNMVDGVVVHPPEVVRHDGDDPYLVVAADKGTAHLSDTANSVAKHYGFWLGDAFASGGSVGYDHKKVGITARGAWECIKHHFHNLGIDVAQDLFTVAGIGDMSGDVFGNGMLSSRAIKLVAAFNHLHIFVDPSPDPETSFEERQRLFRLQRSGWRDYDTSKISHGGGIFDRSAKAISVTPEIKAVLGIESSTVSGEEMIRCILKAPVDLLYNGGIGTYIKATGEEHLDAGDRANDRVRVNASEVRARVIGEGGNLGLTQNARIEYWAKGGILNTDAVDNSGGVDMSDHEVNIKILMDILVKHGVLSGKSERDRIFLEMTEDVASLVLVDNAAQALALTLDGSRSAERYEDFLDLLRELIREGVMNRSDDDIPGWSELREPTAVELGDESASGSGPARGLMRPLLARILGHVKIWSFSRLLETDFPDSEEGAPLLRDYFPHRLHEYADYFVQHPLRREIVATAAVNHVVNHAGVDFFRRMTKSTSGADIGAVIQAYLRCSRKAGASELRRDIAARGRSADETKRALLELERVLESATHDALNGGSDDPAVAVAGLRKSIGL
jgi:glutamate dehydrogenase